MEKFYRISEEELCELLTDSFKLNALENDCIDKWDWEEAISNFLQRNSAENFSEIAKNELQYYERIE